MSIALVCAAGGAWPENPAAGAAAGSLPGLSSVQVVEQMQSHNQARTEGLKHYKALRHYQVEYRGFSTTIAAQNVGRDIVATP